jgi:hypothetical protein
MHSLRHGNFRYVGLWEVMLKSLPKLAQLYSVVRLMMLR